MEGRCVLRFPKVEDIPLRKPPLVDVVCQVRFPPILAITATPPVAFQDRVREAFPHLEAEHGLVVELPGPGSPHERPQVGGTTTVYRFRSTTGTAAISLGQDFVAVSTSDYRGWPGFSDLIRLAVEAAQTAYRPADATRVGLRYVNALTLANTGAASATELVQFPRDELSVLLRTQVWNLPTRMLTELNLHDDHADLTFRIGFISNQDNPRVLLDFDCYEEGAIALDSVESRTRRYHDIVYAAFRWSIPDDRLSAFEPQRGTQQE
jgi:uncharacterized protein (TIGR04255 family)